MKLYTAPGFTEASATVAKEISERKIAFLRRFLKRTVEREIYTELLKANNLDPVKDHVTLTWGVERPELDFASLMSLAQTSAMTGIPFVTKDEVRNMLRKFGLEITEQPTQAEPQPPPDGDKTTRKRKR